MGAPNKKTPHSFQCRDSLWTTFEEMAKELECSVDYLINDAMKQYARQRGYLGDLSSATSPLPAQPAGAAGRPGAAPPPRAPGASLAPPAPPAPPGGVSFAPPFPPAAPPGPAVVVPAPHLPGGAPPAPGLSRAPRAPTPAHGLTAPPPLPPGFSAPVPQPAITNPIGLPPLAPSARPQSPLPRGTTPGSGAFPQPAFPQQGPPPVPAVKLPPPPPAGATHTAARSLTIHYQGQPHHVNKERFIIGRGKTASDLTIRDPNVSRQHALVEYSGGNFYMVDMGSTNGIEFSGQRVHRKAIQNGDVFKICEHELFCSMQ